ncbi:hypothetical protein [Acuticoccus sediminis]|uniref:hypothetical protein n=1 Tax=Acuticoccus sediminis TaxID=2184697 RepID=UPI001CFC9539|nr:hypothetical protein [Acuticoccus sediminis]
MSAVKYTPGPWRVNDRWNLTEVLGDLAGRHDCLIANAGGVTLGGVDISDLRSEQRANARLISAAPDLLNAVEIVLDAANDRLAGGLGHELPPSVRHALEAAVAKAKEGAS